MTSGTGGAPPPVPPVPFGYRAVAAVLAAMFRVLRWQIDLRGTEHVPTRGGAVLTWNHTGHLDYAVTAVPMFGRTGRWVRLLALRQLWRSGTVGWAPRLAHCVPVDRDEPAGRDRPLRDAVAALAAGHLVMVAPEGTISPSFELLPFRTGAVRMAQDAGVPVVPTVSWGSHRFTTTGRRPSLRQAWRLPVVVRIGEAIHVAPDEDPIMATQRLRRTMDGLLAAARADYPDGAPRGAWWVPRAAGGGAPCHDDRLAGGPSRPGVNEPSERAVDAD